MLQPLHVRPVRRPVAARSAGDGAAPGQRLHAGQPAQGLAVDVRRQAGTAREFQRVAQQAETGDVGQRMHAGQAREFGAGAVELGRRLDHGGVALSVEFALLQRRRQDAHAQRLAEDQHVARLRRGVALEVLDLDDADAHQAVDGLDRIDGMPAREWNAGLAAHRLAAFQDLRDHFVRQHVDRHAHDGQRHQRLRAHGVQVRQRVGRRDAAEVARVVHDGHEEVGGRDDGLAVVDAVDGGVVGRLGAHQQVGKDHGRQAALGQQCAQHARRDLAAAAAAVGQGGETGGEVGRGRGHGGGARGDWALWRCARSAALG